MTKEYKSFIFTGNKKSCSGCGACSQICKHTAITMEPDDEGFLFPSVNKDKCVNCGLCDLICPAVGNNQANQEQVQHSYIATTKQKEYYKESASIGICTMLSDHIVSQGGVVYGCYLDENDWTAYHTGVSDKEGVQRLRNSKYLQSNTKQTFTEVKAKLAEGKFVLYIGTPCQIAGLKAFLRKDYSNLYTIDIVCHGTFSPKLMPLEIRYWEKMFDSKISNFRFRSKRRYTRSNAGMVNFDIISNGKKKHIERHASSSPTYHCYAYAGDGVSYNLRLSCYNCRFKKSSRYGDITVGDPWLIDNGIIKNPLLRSTNIVRSLYSVNSEKGEDLISNIISKITVERMSVNQAFVQDALKDTPLFLPDQRKTLYEGIECSDYGSLVETTLCCDLVASHKFFVKSYYISLVKYSIKTICKKLNII